MEHIWAPWRVKYILGEKAGGCFLCDKPRENKDAENFILCRGKNNFIIMNGYPYNPGHLLVATYRHTGDPVELSAEERDEHFELVCRSIEILKKTLKPDGFNTGSNLGKVGGAGVAEHFHSHVVPRWLGDTNFMPVVADVKVVSQALAETYRALAGKF